MPQLKADRPPLVTATAILQICTKNPVLKSTTFLPQIRKKNTDVQLIGILEAVSYYIFFLPRGFKNYIHGNNPKLLSLQKGLTRGSAGMMTNSGALGFWLPVPAL
jgi:hypothetical protein